MSYYLPATFAVYSLRSLAANLGGTMSLKEKLAEDLKQAMRAGDETRKTTLRMVIAAVKTVEGRDGQPLDDEGVLGLVAKEAKQRRESIAEFRKASRQDLIAEEEAELEVLLTYLPKQLSREEIETAARQVIEEVGASGPAQLGIVMRNLMPLTKGKADGKVVNQVVRDILASM